MAYIKCSDDVHGKLKVFAAQRDTTMQNLVEKWIASGMGEESNGEAVLDGLTSSNQKLLREIAEVLRREKEVKEFAQFARTARAYLDLFRPLGLLPDRE